MSYLAFMVKSLQFHLQWTVACGRDEDLINRVLETQLREDLLSELSFGPKTHQQLPKKPRNGRHSKLHNRLCNSIREDRSSERENTDVRTPYPSTNFFSYRQTFISSSSFMLWLVDCFYSRYLSEKPQHWLENHSVVVNEIENINQIKMTLNVNHTINFQDFVEKNRRRTELVLELKKIFEELKIQYCLLPQQIHLLDKVKECWR